MTSNVIGCFLARVAMLAAIFGIVGCNVPIPIFPFPILPMAPKVELLPDEELQSSLIDKTMQDVKDQKRSRSTWMAVRSGRGVILEDPLSEEEFLASLPSPSLKVSFLGEMYIPPPHFTPPKKGDKHYFNFRVTQEFADANRYYLFGQAGEALQLLERILNQLDNDPTLLWQSSYLKVMVLIMMGRHDLAEQEIARTEKLELAVMDKNISSRSLRAEVRYWAGDIEGAARDAGQVVAALGDWRFPTSFATPPLDQAALANVVTAHFRGALFLGLTLLAKGEHKEALPWLELSNQTMNNVMFVNRHPLYGLYFPAYQELFYGRGMTLMALGTNLQMFTASDQRSTRVESMFRHAAEYFDAMGYQVGNVLIKTFRARAYAIAGNHRQAVREAEQGVKLAERAELLTYIWRLEMLRGQSLLELGHWFEGEKALRHAQAVVDLMSGTLVTDKAKVRFGNGKEAITHNLIRVDLRKGDLRSLFQDLERGRARAFVSMLADKKVAGGRQNPILNRIHALDAEIIKVRQQKNALTSGRHAAPHRERQLLEKRLDLVKVIRQLDPDLASTLSVATIELPEVQALLGADDLLVYFLPSKQTDLIRLFLIRKTEASLKTAFMTGKDLRSSLDAFMSAQNSPAAQQSALERIGQGIQISKWGDLSAVYVVPSGDLHFVPWGALDINFPVAVLPTGGWLARTTLPEKDRPEVVSVGDPAFGGLFPQLPGARAEAKSVAGLYRSRPLIGAAATQTALRQGIGNGVDVLHLATHALYDPVFPLQSALILTNGRSAVPLTAEALFRNPLKAKLVVLSACETGMGQVIAGDDLLGLTRSFYLGGAQAVVSSLWPVDDEATRIFMEVFHKESRTGSYGMAWLKARNTLQSQGFSPFAYGAFILGGSMGRSVVEEGEAARQSRNLNKNSKNL